MTLDEALSKGLPKWPQLLITGKTVTPDQAFEIMSRTEGFLNSTCKHSGGNNRTWNEYYRSLAGIDKINEKKKSRYAVEEEWKVHSRFVDTEYIYNHWASSSFVYGPAGWCGPDGRINFRHNVGKWPGMDDIYNDLNKIASAFPFVDMVVTAMSGESCEESEPVASFHVKEGKVVVIDNNDAMTYHEYAGIDHRNIEQQLMNVVMNRNEQGLPPEMVVKHAKKMYEFIKQFH